MIRALTLIAALLLALPALAQEQEPPATTLIGPPVAEAAAVTLIDGIDYAAWQRTAQRTATISENGTGSSFALERLRSDLVTWRDRFLRAQALNASRISTVQAQIAALGPVPEGGAEDSRVAERRAALAAELGRLRAPVLLAEEAYAQANGLIAEIDTLLRQRRADAITTRGQSPLNPAHWPGIAADLSGLIGNLWKEASVTFASAARRAVLAQNLGQVLFYALAGAILLARGRRWMARLSRMVTARTRRHYGVWGLVISLGQLALPYFGLSAIVLALQATGLPGFRLSQIIEQIPNAGAFAIFARWLSERLFSDGSNVPLAAGFDPGKRARARREVSLMGWFIGAGSMILAILDAGEVSPVAATAAILPAQILLCWVLFRFGQILLAPPEAAAAELGEAVNFRRGLMSLLGRVTMGVAVVGPVLTALGYSVAGEALTYPFAMTLALIGVVMILQTFAFDIYALVMGDEDGSRDALLPVIVATLLTVAALPALALFWGLRVEDLAEMWTRFREGYSIGDTRISPTDFLTFALIFAVGFMLTRLIQGVLRTTILPKTRIDQGGRTAILSGIGYVGIFLSGLFAITTAGLDLSNIAIVAGALSVGIGFGLQNIVSNFISGIILLIERPISEGDWIEVGGKMGYVRDISVRSTRIETFDRTNVIVPNADLISGQVTNWTRGSSVGRIIVPVSVMFGTDIPRVMSILKEIAEGHPMVLLNPPPSVVLQNFGPDVLNFEIRAIVRDVNFGLSVRSEMNVEIANRFFTEGIEFAGGARANAAAGRTATSPRPGPAEMRVRLIREDGAAPAGDRPGPEPEPDTETPA